MWTLMRTEKIFQKRKQPNMVKEIIVMPKVTAKKLDVSLFPDLRIFNFQDNPSIEQVVGVHSESLIRFKSGHSALRECPAEVLDAPNLKQIDLDQEHCKIDDEVIAKLCALMDRGCKISLYLARKDWEALLKYAFIGDISSHEFEFFLIVSFLGSMVDNKGRLRLSSSIWLELARELWLLRKIPLRPTRRRAGAGSKMRKLLLGPSRNRRAMIRPQSLRTTGPTLMWLLQNPKQSLLRIQTLTKHQWCLHKAIGQLLILIGTN